MEKDFVIKNNVLIEYKGTDKIVQIPENIKTIGDRAFFYNTNIEKIILPSNLKTIGHSSFKSCINLKEINLENVKNIEVNAFNDCKKIININLESAINIRNGAFYSCKNLKIIKFGNNSNIESYAFADCNIEEIILPQKTKFKNTTNVFSFNENLKKVKINCEIDETNKDMFDECNNMEEIIINNKEKLYRDSYGFNLNLKKIEINNPNYKVKDEMIYSTDETELIWCPENTSFVNYNIPDSVKIIKEYCFFRNKTIENIVFGKNIEIIQEESFALNNIKNIIFNEKLKEIKRFSLLKTKTNKIDLTNTSIDKLDIPALGLDNQYEIYLPKNISKLIIGHTAKMGKVKIKKYKENCNETIKKFIDDKKIECLKTLDELIEEGKSFQEANQIIKVQER